MEKWKRQPQEVDGEYLFGGQLLVTRGVHEKIPAEEIISIVMDVKKAVTEQLGLDYLQTYKNSKGEKIWLIDHYTKDDLAEMTPEQKEELDHFTMLFPHEY